MLVRFTIYNIFCGFMLTFKVACPKTIFKFQLQGFRIKNYNLCTHGSRKTGHELNRCL